MVDRFSGQVVKKPDRVMSTLAFCLAMAAALTACTSTQQNPPAHSALAPRPVGGERDEQGCLGSAGYAWCAHENVCVRPWELASEKGFERGPQGFERFCSSMAK